MIIHLQKLSKKKIVLTDHPDVFVSSNSEGIERVEKADGKYAFFMESSSIQYIIERNCAVTQIGGTLDTKVMKNVENAIGSY